MRRNDLLQGKGRKSDVKGLQHVRRYTHQRADMYNYFFIIIIPPVSTARWRVIVTMPAMKSQGIIDRLAPMLLRVLVGTLSLHGSVYADWSPFYENTI